MKREREKGRSAGDSCEVYIDGVKILHKGLAPQAVRRSTSLRFARNDTEGDLG